MRKILLIFLILAPILVSAQERKTYKGNYNYHGYAAYVEYDYIEKDGKRVFDGYFKMGSVEEGNFKNDLKDGVWKFGNQKRTYINGKLNGLLEDQYRGIFDYTSRSVKIWYKDNHFAGNFSIDEYTGQFDADGYADGEWISYGKDNYGVIYKRTQKWEHGYLISDIAYDESTGQSTDLILFSGVIKGRLVKGVKNGDGRSWNDRSGSEKYFSNSDGTMYCIAYFYPSMFQQSILIDYFFGNRENNTLVIKSGFRKGTTGEYCMTVFPFLGIKRPLTEQEQQRFDAKQQEEKDKKETAERERKEKAEQREKEIQTAVANFDNSVYGRFINTVRESVKNGKTLDEAKHEVISSLSFHFTPQISSVKDLPDAQMLVLPFQFQLKDDNWVIEKYLTVIDNKMGLLNEKAVDSNLIRCDLNKIAYSSPPCVIYESSEIIVGIDKTDYYIVNKKKNQTKQLNSLNNSGNKLGKGFFYSINASSVKGATNPIDLINGITMDDVNMTTRERFDKLNNNDVAVLEKTEKVANTSNLDVEPVFPGGKDALQNFISDNINYSIARRQGIDNGNVGVKFLINTDGSISDIKITRSLESNCDQEVIRVIKSMPNWVPAKIKKEERMSQYILLYL